jgi:hypothetical protein
LVLFDFVVFRRTGTQTVVDLGLLAETLLFYHKVHIVFDAGSLLEFIRTIGLSQLVGLLGREGVTGSFQRDTTGVVTNTAGGVVLHNCAIFRVSGDQETKNFTDKGFVESVLRRELGHSRETKRLLRKFIERITFSPLPHHGQGIEDILGACENDLADESFLRDSVEKIFMNNVPGGHLPSRWDFRVHFVGTRYGEQPQFAVETNLNFDALNAVYHQRVPPSHSSLTPAYFITFIISAREAEYIASKHMSELIIDPVTSSVVRLKCLELMRKRDKQCTETDLFQNMTFQDSRTIREALNSGERTFDEFLRLLDKASKFKKFLAGQNPERGLLESFTSELTKEDWVNKLPRKVTRIVLASGLGVAAETLFPTGGISTIIGFGYSAFDSLLLDKLVKGWRPNQFIDDQLIPFVSGRR